MSFKHKAMLQISGNRYTLEAIDVLFIADTNQGHL